MFLLLFSCPLSWVAHLCRDSEESVVYRAGFGRLDLFSLYFSLLTVRFVVEFHVVCA